MAKITDLTLEQFATTLQGPSGTGGRLLGLDLGTKTIGLAISDSNWSISAPVKTIRRTKFTADVQELLEFTDSERVAGIVMGLPLNMDGTEGPRAQATRAFIRNMANFSDLPVIYWDERLSSVEAEEFMHEAGLKRKKRQQNIDQIAATIILQGCLTQLCLLRDGNTGEQMATT